MADDNGLETRLRRLGVATLPPPPLKHIITKGLRRRRIRVLEAIGSGMALLGVLVWALLGLSGLGTPHHATTASGRGPLTALERPLRLPALAPGARCPAAPVSSLPQGGALRGTGRRLGPLWATAEFAGKAVPLNESSENPIDGWYAIKALWEAPPTYRGPVLLRGRQIDGPNGLRFSGFASPTGPLQTQMLLGDSAAQVKPSGWRDWGGAIYARAPGCYALQADGTDFSAVMAFRLVVR